MLTHTCPELVEGQGTQSPSTGSGHEHRGLWIGSIDVGTPVVLAPVTMPSPEQLGIALARTTEQPIDWALMHARLHQLGAGSFSLERLSPSGYRFRCWLPRRAGDTQPIEASAGTEAEAVRLCLERAGRWVAQDR